VPLSIKAANGNKAYLALTSNQKMSHNNIIISRKGKAKPIKPIGHALAGLINGAAADSKYKKTKMPFSANKNPLVKLRNTL
jgi:hypothetical protein